MNILIIDDEYQIRQTMSLYLQNQTHQVDTARDGYEALKKVENNDYDVAFIDYKLPGIDGLKILSHLALKNPEITSIMFTAYGNMDIILQTFRNGGFDFLQKPIKFNDLDTILCRIAQLHKQKILEKKREHSQPSQYINSNCLIGQSQTIDAIRDKIKLIVSADCKRTLLRGETGTGKDVIAREIHHLTGIDESKFIVVNCPTLPETLFESEVFGHIRGSFTGASYDKIGCFQLADEGTLYLDEIGELPLSGQAKLLRFLETEKFRPIGGKDEIKVNVRIIAATNKPLESLTKRAKFRQDLYYRLQGITVYIPPLRERADDIIPLAEYFLRQRSPSGEITGFSEKSLKLLQGYDYPGNVRELRDIVNRAVMFCSSNTINKEELRAAIYDGLSNDCRNQNVSNEENEKLRIIEALNKTKWNRKKAAKLLNMPYSTLRYKIGTLNIL